MVAACAMAAGLFWPLVLITALVRFRPPPSAAERAEALAASRARIAVLEAGLGIRGGTP